MQDIDKTKEQLLAELTALRRRVAALEAERSLVEARPDERRQTEAELQAYRDHLVEPVEARTYELTVANEQLRREIADRQRTEEALKTSQEYAKSIIESSLDMIIAVDMDRRIIEFNRAAQETFGYQAAEVLGKRSDLLYADPDEAPEVHRLTTEQGRCVREIHNIRKNGEIFPSFLSASVLRNAAGEQVGFMGVSRDITERRQAQKTLEKRNRELELLNLAAQAFISTLDVNQVLATVLDEVRKSLRVMACSAWLLDPHTNELVCRQVTDPQGEIVRGWRLAPGQGLAGWVIKNGKSLNVPNVQSDKRHFKQIDEQTGLPLRSILTVPLRVKQKTIGVLQAVAAEYDRFSDTDRVVLESLAATAAIAIENGRLYEQARQDAETKARLLNEVNHRVKNNLATIIGLLYAERRRVRVADETTYQTIMQDLIGRVQGLATAHGLLSASEWAPLSLEYLTSRVIEGALQVLPTNKRVAVDVSASGPVKVTPKQANSLAMVINELVTNTVKHALREWERGHIRVEIALEDGTMTKSSANGAGYNVIFEFRDDGPGYPQAVLDQEQGNVGLYLIKNIVTKDLRGELMLRNEQGAVTLIRFKPVE
ncbi:MAG: PAS domain S-box protein [Chloroflexota bacterium]